MLHVDVESITGVLQLQPSDALTEEDFHYVESVINPYIAARGPLRGVLIHSQSFPAWDSFSALFEHVKFVGKYHDKIRKIAIVTDSPLGRFADHVVDYFVDAEVKKFPFDDMNNASRWLLH